ncbi:hypothetical protein PYCCODRAFT_342362 [Trametes coccinea BRFM310]|uniref:Uncharacterized protein n=1 Tax=Trametes coccinea (strain BRFM310) TaxID=1353009 RepID=A0A1Y2J2Z1_TRAC3|nr:hypothetical protein PYCCODRAFT_342362 [Trametes coccinea BRFM310]
MVAMLYEGSGAERLTWRSRRSPRRVIQNPPPRLMDARYAMGRAPQFSPAERTGLEDFGTIDSDRSHTGCGMDEHARPAEGTTPRSVHELYGVDAAPSGDRTAFASMTRSRGQARDVRRCVTRMANQQTKGTQCGQDALPSYLDGCKHSE